MGVSVLAWGMGGTVDGSCSGGRALGCWFVGVVGFWWGIGLLVGFRGLGGDRRMVVFYSHLGWGDLSIMTKKWFVKFACLGGFG